MIGLVFAKPIEYGPILAACEEYPPKSIEWLELCLRYGERLEQEDNTLMSTMFGLALQKSMYKITSDANQIARIERKRLDIKKQMYSDSKTHTFDGQMFRRETFLSEYFNRFATEGELAALNYINSLAEDISNSSIFSQCE